LTGGINRRKIPCLTFFRNIAYDMKKITQGKCLDSEAGGGSVIFQLNMMVQRLPWPNRLSR